MRTPTDPAATSPTVIVFRVAVTVYLPHLERARVLFTDLTHASRTVPGVLHFDILQDPAHPTRFVSIEVYQDQDALDRQEQLPELQQVMAAFGEILADGPHGTKYFVSAHEPWPSTGPRWTQI